MTDEELIKKEYDKSQCVFGPDSKMCCMICSHTCPARYKDFLEKGVKMAVITKDGLKDIN